MRVVRRLLPILVLALATAAAAQDRPTAADQKLRTAVVKSLQDHKLLRGSNPQVDVTDGSVHLSGEVRSYWEKEEIIKWARAVDGVMRLVSDLTIARAESDKAIADALGDKVLHYSRYSVFDDISARVKDGVVSLEGSVTAPEKSDDIFEMAGRIQGVQSVANAIHVYQTSRADDRLRLAIGQRIFGDPDLQRYAIGANSPIRIIVEHGDVTLKGYVYSDLDKIRIESRVRDIFGIQKFNNQLQVTGGR